jgi:cytochrome c5
MAYKKMVLVLALALILGTGLLLACGGSDATDTPQAQEPEAAPEEEAEEAEPAEPSLAEAGQALLEERCTSCHGLDRTTSQTKTREEWEQTVTRMVQKGAELNDQEMTTLIDYLAETYGP